MSKLFSKLYSWDSFLQAIVLYWISSQCVTVAQYHYLNRPSIKKYYQLDLKPNNHLSEMMKADTEKKNAATKNLGMWARIKEGTLFLKTNLTIPSELLLEVIFSHPLQHKPIIV